MVVVVVAVIVVAVIVMIRKSREWNNKGREKVSV